jgi:DNA gyrase subunit A
MKELGLEHNKPYRKCARVIGEVLGKFHPHGDMAVYDALARMVQDFSLRYPLIDGQGNFGSVDGDPPAAMRYTEARMERITALMLQDIEKETVDFVPNFDSSLQEPKVLPTVLPNLLLNGSGGIAVGMATNMPPHNLSEVCAAIKLLIERPHCEVKDLMRLIPGPDFPTGGLICGREGIRQAYLTGRGKLILRARAHTEQQKSGKETIVINEIPYQVNKNNLITAIANLVQNKRLEGIADLRDESDKDGMRIVIDLKRGQNSEIILNQLYKHTQMECTFGVIMLALVDGEPRVLNLKQLLERHIAHRKTVITRRTRFDLKKAEARAHILEGLKIALANLDKVIRIIRQSKDPQLARIKLIASLNLSERQAQAILEMQLQRLTSLERKKIDQEYLELIKRIEYLRSILASERKVLDLIKEEADEIKKNFGDERRTAVVGKVEDIEIEDLIAEEDMVITITHAGYIKRLPVTAYRRQHRGGRGVTAIGMKEEDFVEHLFIASTHECLLFFSKKGRAYWLKVHEIPQAGRAAKGTAIVNLLQVASGEEITAWAGVRDFTAEKFLVMVTRRGLIKKVSLNAFSNPRKGGIIAITLDENDELMQAKLTNGKEEIFLATAEGKAIRFKETAIRAMGRTAKGVRAIRLSKKDEVIGMEIVTPQATLLTVTASGYSKRTPFKDYRLQSRGGKGIINLKATNKTGPAIGIKTVTEQGEVMIISAGGLVVRCPVKDIRICGRNTQGVHVIRLSKKDSVSCVASVVAK